MNLLKSLSSTIVFFYYTLALTYRQKFSVLAVQRINHERSLRHLRPLNYSYKLSEVARSRLSVTKEKNHCQESKCGKSFRRALANKKVEIESSVHQDCTSALESLFQEKLNLDIIFNRNQWCESWNSAGAFCQSNRVILRFNKKYNPRKKHVSYNPNHLKSDNDRSCRKQVKTRINTKANRNKTNTYAYQLNKVFIKKDYELNKRKLINNQSKKFIVPILYHSDIHIFYSLVNKERMKFHLNPIPFSPELSKVAQAKSENMEKFLFKQTDSVTRLHDWYGQYACEYIKNFDCMNKKPQQLSDYKGDGYEITFAGKGFDAKAIFKAWIHSPGHRDVIMSRGTFEGAKWQAVGAGRTESMANIWFGYEPDPHYL